MRLWKLGLKIQIFFYTNCWSLSESTGCKKTCNNRSTITYAQQTTGQWSRLLTYITARKIKTLKIKLRKNEDREKKTIKCTDIRLTDRGFLARYQVGIWRAGFVGQSSRRDVCLGPGVATDRATTGRIWRLGSTTSSDWQLTWGWCAWDDQG